MAKTIIQDVHISIMSHQDPLVVLDEHVAFSRPLNSWQPTIVGVTARSGALSWMMYNILIFHHEDKLSQFVKKILILFSFTVFPAAAGATGPAQDPWWKENFSFLSVDTNVTKNVQCPCRKWDETNSVLLIFDRRAPFNWFASYNNSGPINFSA